MTSDLDGYVLDYNFASRKALIYDMKTGTKQWMTDEELANAGFVIPPNVGSCLDRVPGVSQEDLIYKTMGIPASLISPPPRKKVECEECFGTGYYKGFGGPCKKGCKGA